MTPKQKGIIFITFSAFSFAVMNLFVKLAGDLPFYQKSFFRNVISVLVAIYLLKKDTTPSQKLTPTNKKHLFFRSLFGTIGVCCNFYAVDHIPLSDASMLNKMSPFFILLFSYLFLKEKLSLVQFSSVVLAFIGAIFVAKPTMDLTEFFPSLIGFIGGMSAGAAYTNVRFLGNAKVKSTIIVFVFSAFSCIVMLPLLIFAYTPMTLMQLCSLLMAGVCATGGQFGITLAYAQAPAKEISVFDYSQIPFSALLGWVFFSQIPDTYSFIGYGIILLAASLTFFCGDKKTQ